MLSKTDSRISATSINEDIRCSSCRYQVDSYCLKEFHLICCNVAGALGPPLNTVSFKVPVNKFTRVLPKILLSSEHSINYDVTKFIIS